MSRLNFGKSYLALERLRDNKAKNGDFETLLEYINYYHNVKSPKIHYEEFENGSKVLDYIECSNCGEVLDEMQLVDGKCFCSYCGIRIG